MRLITLFIVAAVGLTNGILSYAGEGSGGSQSSALSAEVASAGRESGHAEHLAASFIDTIDVLKNCTKISP